MRRFGDLLISTITYDPERFYLFYLFIYLFGSNKQERRQRHSRPLPGCSVAHVITLRGMVVVPFVILASEA